MTQTIFDIDPSVEGGDEPQSYYDQLVGEGKKYATPELAAKALVDKDNYIKKLEGENSVYRDTSSKLDSVLDKLSTKTNEPSTSNSLPTNGNDDSEKVDIDTLVESKLESILESKTAKEQSDANAQRALDQLSEYYGDASKAKLAVNRLTKDNPQKDVYLTLAGSDPEAFTALVKAKVPISNTTTDPLLGTGDMNNIPDNKSIVKWSDAKQVLLTNRKQYYSKEYQAVVNASEEYYRSKGVDYYKQT